MGNLQHTMSIAFESIVVVAVVALVWITVLAGLVQLVLERIRFFQRAVKRNVREMYAQRIDTGRQALSHPPAAGH